MSNDIDLRELWNKQETTIPNVKELFEKIRNFKRSKLRKLIIANILLLSTSAFMVFIWYYYQPEMTTTKIGIVLTILAMVLYLYVYNQMIPTLVKVDFDMSSSQYLQQLLKLREKQVFLQNTMLNIYFIFLSTGICIYMFEYTSRMTLFWATFSYGLMLLWIAINWFYLRPRSIKKQQTKINELISKLEGVNRQLTTCE